MTRELISRLRAGTVTPRDLDDAADKLEWLMAALASAKLQLERK